MSRRNLTKQFFENTQEQNKIEQAILSALPDGVFMCNLVIVLARMASHYAARTFEEEVFTRSTGDKP